jgi:uncharacterized protein (DUF2141 family)
MQKVIVIVVMLLFSKLSIGQTVSVQINDLKNEKGICFVCLFSKSDGFPDNPKSGTICMKSKINGTVAKTTFNDVKVGTYAISVFHDENSNGKLDTNFLGIPKEGYGVSNNKLPKMSKPKFEDAKFILNADKGLIINIKY